MTKITILFQNWCHWH